MIMDIFLLLSGNALLLAFLLLFLVIMKYKRNGYKKSYPTKKKVSSDIKKIKEQIEE